jgi:hypothetical protein
MIYMLTIVGVSIVIWGSMVLAIVILVIEVVEIEAIVLRHVVMLERSKSSEPINLGRFWLSFRPHIVLLLRNSYVHWHVIIMLFRNGL